MKKIVNVLPSIPVHALKRPIIDPMISVELAVGDIQMCLLSGAIVEEIIDGKHIKLDLKNYNVDNSTKNEEFKVEEPKVEEPKVEEPKVEEPKVEMISRMSATMVEEEPIVREIPVKNNKKK